MKKKTPKKRPKTKAKPKAKKKIPDVRLASIPPQQSLTIPIRDPNMQAQVILLSHTINFLELIMDQGCKITWPIAIVTKLSKNYPDIFEEVAVRASILADAYNRRMVIVEGDKAEFDPGFVVMSIQGASKAVKELAEKAK